MKLKRASLWAVLCVLIHAGAAVAQMMPPAPGLTDGGGGMMLQTSTYPVGTVLSLNWDPYTAAELTNSQADRYEVALSGPTPGTATLAITATTFKLPTLAIGRYAITLKGCNPDGCGPAATLEFDIKALVPGVPRNPRLSPEPAPVSLEQATALAHAYSTLLRLRPLNDPEMMWLVARYQNFYSPAPPSLTRTNVLHFLDQVSAELLQGR